MTYKYYNTRKEKFNGKTYYSYNRGSMLEDLVHERLCKDDKKFDCDRFFISIKRNLDFIMNNVTYEIDNFAMHINKQNGKTYALLFEDKLGNGSKSKAHKQLRRSNQYVLTHSSIDKVFLFYIHNFNKKKKSYTVEWYRPYSNIKNKSIKELLYTNEFLYKQDTISKHERNRRKAMLYDNYDKRNHAYKKLYK